MCDILVVDVSKNEVHKMLYLSDYCRRQMEMKNGNPQFLQLQKKSINQNIMAIIPERECAQVNLGEV